MGRLTPGTMLDQRRCFRYPLGVPCTLLAGDARQHSFLVRNVSLTGFSGSTFLVHEIGDNVTLDLPPLGPRAARIAWRKDMRFGAEFVHHLGPDQLEALLATCETGVVDLAATGDGASSTDSEPPSHSQLLETRRCP